MRDRVDVLRYRVVGKPRIREYENSALRVVISDGVADIFPKHEVPSIDAAERLIGEFLRSFEADEALRGDEPVSFQFERGVMKSGAGKYVGLRFNFAVTGDEAEANTREQTPWRRHVVSATPDAARLVERYESYRAGRETLTTVAYVALSFLQQRAGGRTTAAAKFLIEKDVLNHAGRLSSDRGDLGSARKFDSRSTNAPLDQAETFWLEAATRLFIVRIHEIEAGKPLRDITMSDLPPLTPAV